MDVEFSWICATFRDSVDLTDDSIDIKFVDVTFLCLTDII